MLSFIYSRMSMNAGISFSSCFLSVLMFLLTHNISICFFFAVNRLHQEYLRRSLSILFFVLCKEVQKRNWLLKSWPRRSDRTPRNSCVDKIKMEDLVSGNKKNKILRTDPMLQKILQVPRGPLSVYNKPFSCVAHFFKLSFFFIIVSW